jgi:hypothetical protein
MGRAWQKLVDIIAAGIRERETGRGQGQDIPRTGPLVNYFL